MNFDKKLTLEQLDINKQYLLVNEEDIYEDEQDYLDSISSEYLGIKDNIEAWENQMLEENCEWLTGLEILHKKLDKFEEKRLKR